MVGDSNSVVDRDDVVVFSILIVGTTGAMVTLFEEFEEDEEVFDDNDNDADADAETDADADADTDEDVDEVELVESLMPLLLLA